MDNIKEPDFGIYNKKIYFKLNQTYLLRES